MSMAYKVNIESCDNNGTRLGQHGDVELGFLTQHSASAIFCKYNYKKIDVCLFQ